MPERTFWIKACRGDYSIYTCDIIRADLRMAINARGYPRPVEAYIRTHEALPNELLQRFVAIYRAAAENLPDEEIVARAKAALFIANDLGWKPLEEAQAAYYERLRKHNERVTAYHEWRDKRLNRGICSGFAECPSRQCDCYNCWWGRVGRKKFDD